MEQSFRLAPITLIYGPNSSGKSSIVQSLLLLKQSLEEPLQPFNRKLMPKGKHVDLGNSTSIYYRHKINNPLEFTVGLKPPSSKRFGWLGSVSIKTKFEKPVRKTNLWQPELTEIAYCVKFSEGAEFVFTLVKGHKAEPALSLFDEEFDDLSGTERIVFTLKDESSAQAMAETFLTAETQMLQAGFIAMPSKDEKVDEIAKKLLDSEVIFRRSIAGGISSFPDEFVHSQGRFHFSRALRFINRMFDDSLASMTHLGPLRQIPERVYRITGGHETVGTSGENTVSILFQKNFSSNNNDKRVVNKLNDWLKKFEIPYKISIKPLDNELTGTLAILNLKDMRTGVNVAPTDVGFGISQFLPILVEGITTERSNLFPHLICVEQPELHLHPKLQAHLGDFFIDTAINSKNCQWIVETHSESLILRLQRRIRDKAIKPNDISVIFVNPVPDFGSQVRELRLDPNGSFMDEWPGGFFEESYNELFN